MLFPGDPDMSRVEPGVTDGISNGTVYISARACVGWTQRRTHRRKVWVYLTDRLDSVERNREKAPSASKP